jgi:hypothetical protein
MYAGCRFGLRVTVPNTTHAWGLSAMPIYQSGVRLFFTLGVDKCPKLGPAPKNHKPFSDKDLRQQNTLFIFWILLDSS